MELVGPEAVADVVNEPGHLQLGVVGAGAGELVRTLQPVVELAQPGGLLGRLGVHGGEQVEELEERHVTPPGIRPIPPSYEQHVAERTVGDVGIATSSMAWAARARRRGR